MQKPPSDEKLAFLSVCQLQELIVNQVVSSVEVTKVYLARIEQYNPTYHAYLTVCKEEALKAAKEADAMVRKGSTTRPLLGVPIAICDTLDVQGVSTSMGSAVFVDRIAKTDCLEVGRLRDAGAVILGKTNCSEFNLSPWTENRLGDPCRNPCNVDYSPGGSHGGAAVAVAAGLAAAALAADGTGATRLPSSYCGVMGFKATKERIPLVRRGPVPISKRKFYQAATVTRSAQDAARLLGVLAHPDPRDPSSLSDEDSNFEKAMKEELPRLKIGWSANLGFISQDENTLNPFLQTMETLKELDVSVQEEELEITQDVMMHFCNVLAADYYIPLVSVCGSDHTVADRFTQYVQRWLDMGRHVPGYAYSMGLVYRRWLRKRIDALFTDVDLLITPAVIGLPRLLDSPREKLTDNALLLKQYAFTLPFNMTGHPAVVVSTGLSCNDVPIGMQIVAPYCREHSILQFVQKWEKRAELKL